MSEWFKVPVLKTGMLFKVSGVRILPHPYQLECYAVLAFSELLLVASCIHLGGVHRFKTDGLGVVQSN